MHHNLRDRQLAFCCFKYVLSRQVCEGERGENMTIELIFKIAAVGILVTILGQVLKHSGREEQAFLVSLAGLFIVLSWIIPCINELFSEIYSLFQL